MNILEQLKNLNLNATEAKIFLAIIEIGPASISDIAKRAQIKRPTAYYIIEELIKGGLIIKVPNGKRIFYQSVPPQNILDLLDKKRDNMQKILPELEALYRAKPGQPKVRYYEGKDGIFNLYKEIVNTHKNLYTIFSLEDFLKVFTEKDNEELFDIMKKAGGFLYDLIKPSPAAQNALKIERFRKGISRAKFLPADFKVTTDLITTGNKVGIISFKSLVGVLIEDQDIAASQQEFIKYIWKTIK